MKEQCDNCIYKHTEYRNAGYGMPVQEKEKCLLEEQHKPCDKETDINNALYEGVKVMELGS